MLFYAAILHGLHNFLLVFYGDDFLERAWLAPQEVPYKEFFALAGAVFVAHLAALQPVRASCIFVTLLAVIPILPMLAVFAHRGAGSTYMVMCLACYFLIWAANSVQFKLGRVNLPQFVDWRYFVGGTLVLFVLIIVGSIYSGNLAYLNFDFSRVYEFRADAIGVRSPVIEYSILNAIAFFAPLSIALVLRERKYVLYIVVFVAIFMIFGLTSHKSYVLTPLLATAVFLIVNRFRSHYALVLAFTGLVFTMTFAYQLGLIDETLPTLTVRRMFFVPAYLNFLFHDFFSIGPKMLWSDSLLSMKMVDNPYGAVASRLIMNYYGGGGSMGLSIDGTANTGFLGAGYGNGGFGGMLFYSLIIVFLLRMTDMLADRVGIATTCGGLSHLFVTVLFASTDTLSSFLSYGSLLLIVFALVFKTDATLYEGSASTSDSSPRL